MSRKQKPPSPPDYNNPALWRYEISEDGLWGWAPYRVRLFRVDGLAYGANDGWGWSCMTIAGAHRKGKRELKRKRAAIQRGRARRARIEASGGLR